MNEKLKLLNGMEVYSLQYGQCVYIKGKQVIATGLVIDTLNTKAKVLQLWNEVMKSEGIV
jgi:hypothetical protein